MTLANMRELGVHYRLTVFGMRAGPPVLGPVEIQGSSHSIASNCPNETSVLDRELLFL
jgi:hypothetical protein